MESPDAFFSNASHKNPIRAINISLLFTPTSGGVNKQKAAAQVDSQLAKGT